MGDLPIKNDQRDAELWAFQMEAASVNWKRQGSRLSAEP